MNGAIIALFNVIQTNQFRINMAMNSRVIGGTYPGISPPAQTKIASPPTYLPRVEVSEQYKQNLFDAVIQNDTKDHWLNRLFR